MTGDQLTRFEETFASVRPMMVVYYCGSNDLINGQEPGTVAPNVVAFDRLLRDRFPGVPMIFVSSMKSPDRRHWWDRVDRYNELVWSYLIDYPDRHFFDLHPAIHDAAGEPRMELFQPDQLHLLPKAYQRLGRLFQPFLARLLQTRNNWSEKNRKISRQVLPLSYPLCQRLGKCFGQVILAFVFLSRGRKCPV